MNYNPKKYINGFLSIYVMLSWLFTFVISYDFDKLSVVLIAAFLIVLIYEECNSTDNKKYLLKKTSNIPLFFFISCLAFTGQFLYHDIYINKELLTLLSIYVTVVMLGKFKTIINFERIFILYGVLFLISSIVTIHDSPLAEHGYTFQTGAGGILSSFIFYSVFLSLFLVRAHRKYKYFSYISLFFILLLQIRGVVLSVLLTYLTHKGVNRTVLMYIAVGALFIMFLSILMPESRLFSTETSGRLIHWEIIVGKFEMTPSNFIFGMGDGFSTNVLLDHGVGEHMAAPHNEFIRYVLDLGFLGLLLLILIFKELYMRAENRFVILVILQQMMTDNIFTYFHNYLFFVILISMYKYKREGNA